MTIFEHSIFSDTASPDNVNGDVDKGGNCGGKDRATEHSEADARFAMMNIQIEGLRAENLRLSSALRDLAALVTDKAACTQTLALADVKERRSSSRKEKESSDGWPEAFHQRRGPSVEISNIGDSCAHRTSEKNMNVCWVDTMSLSADSHDSVKGAETPVTGKISQAKLLRQLDSIQNQLDATKKQIMGTVRRSSFTKPNPVLADSFRVVNAPLSLTSGRPKSFSNLPSPSSNLSHFPFPSPKSNAVFLPSQEATSRRSAKASIDQLDTDGCEVEKVENCEKFWDLNHLKDEHFNSISRITSDLVDRKKKLSPRYSDEDSRNGLIIAASRCKELAQSSPVNTDLSTALDKYLNVVRKLSASAARTDTRDLGSKDCEEVIISLNNGFQRSMSSNSNSNMTCSNNSNSVSNSVQMESNCNLILKGQHTAWRVSEGARLSPENRMFLGTNECNARPVMTE